MRYVGLDAHLRQSTFCTFGTTAPCPTGTRTSTSSYRSGLPGTTGASSGPSTSQASW
jgi:hypothetical protein